MTRQTYLAVSTDWSKMAYLDFESAYEKAPETIVRGSHEAWSGWDEVLDGIGELASERDARVSPSTSTQASATTSWIGFASGSPPASS